MSTHEHRHETESEYAYETEYEDSTETKSEDIPERKSEDERPAERVRNAETTQGFGEAFQNLILGRYYPHMTKQLMCSAASMFSGVAIAVRFSWYPWLPTFAALTVRHIFGRISGNYKLNFVLPDIRYFTVGGGVLLSCLAITCAGSPRTITISNAIMLIGWAVLALWSSKSAYSYLISYVILELGTICSMNTNIVYVTEIVDPGLRGFFGALSLAVYSLGIIIANLITAVEFHSNPMTATTIGILFCALGFVLSFLIPESPIRLLLNDKYRLARSVFSWLHGGAPSDEIKFRDLVKMAHEHNKRRRESFSYVIVTIFSRQFFKPLILVALICTVYIGVLFEPVVSYFSYKTFDHYWHDEIENVDDPKAFAVTLFAYGTRMVVCMFVSLLIPRLKRRTIFLTSALSAAYGLMLLIMAEQFSLTAAATNVVFVSYVIFTCFGVFSIPFITMAEYFPQPVRQFGSGLAIMYINYAQINTMADRRFDENIERDPVERNSLYWTCCCTVLICTIVLFVIMPETEGLSLSQVEDVVVRGPWIPRKGDVLPTEGGLLVADVATPVRIEITESETNDGQRSE